MKKEYLYLATIVSVYDGDTITVDIDLGFGVELKKQKIRLFGIDAPEVRGEERPEGLKTRDWLREKLLEGTVVLLKTHRDRKGKYGRWLAEVSIDEEGDSVCLNQRMLALRLAEEARY